MHSHRRIPKRTPDHNTLQFSQANERQDFYIIRISARSRSMYMDRDLEQMERRWWAAPLDPRDYFWIRLRHDIPSAVFVETGRTPRAECLKFACFLGYFKVSPRDGGVHGQSELDIENRAHDAATCRCRGPDPVHRTLPWRDAARRLLNTGQLDRRS